MCKDMLLGNTVYYVVFKGWKPKFSPTLLRSATSLPCIYAAMTTTRARCWTETQLAGPGTDWSGQETIFAKVS